MIKIANLKKLIYISKKVGGIVFQGILISLFVSAFVFPLSCHISAEGVEFLGGDFDAPKLESCKVLDDRHVELFFSEGVRLSGVSVTEKSMTSDKAQNIKNNEVTIQSDDGNGKIIIELENNTEIGKSYLLSGIVNDKYGNSLTFSLPFFGFNKTIPKMIMTELLQEFGSLNKEKKGRNEYIKLLALEDGNMFGLVLGSASWKEKTFFNFPAIEVNKGEEVIVHLNNKGEGCVSEIGNNLNLAEELCAKNGIRDLWMDNTDSVLGNGSDVVYLKDSINEILLDGCMYSDGKKTQWTGEFEKCSKELEDKGIVKSYLIENASDISKVSPTHPLIRKNTTEIINRLKNNEQIKLPIVVEKSDWIRKE